MKHISKNHPKTKVNAQNTVNFIPTKPYTDSKQAQYILGKTLALCFFFLFLWNCEKSHQGWTAEQYRKAATSLHQQGLYSQTAEIYEKYLTSTVIPQEDIPKVMYQLGNLYLENLADPAAALSKYTLVQAFAPEETFNNQLGSKMVMAMERMGRSRDAEQKLSSLTNIDAPKEKTTQYSSKIVAQVGDRKITLGEVEEALGSLPKESLEQNNVITQYVAQILMAEAAERKGLHKQPSIQNRLNFIRNQILAQATLSEELKIPPPSKQDLENLFEANKTRYLNDSVQNFSEAQEQVSRDWAIQKQNEFYQRYLQQLLTAEKVTFFPGEKP